jgi:hypothetical protein
LLGGEKSISSGIGRVMKRPPSVFTPLGTRIDHIGNPFGQLSIWSSM